MIRKGDGCFQFISLQISPFQGPVNQLQVNVGESRITAEDLRDVLMLPQEDEQYAWEGCAVAK